MALNGPWGRTQWILVGSQLNGVTNTIFPLELFNRLSGFVRFNGQDVIGYRKCHAKSTGKFNLENGNWKLGNRNPQSEAARRRLSGKIDAIL